MTIKILRSVLFIMALVSVPAQSQDSWEWGGQIRQRLQVFEDEFFGLGAPDNYENWLQRFYGFAQYTPNPRLKLHAGLLSAFDAGAPGGSSPVEENELDLHVAHLKLSIADHLDLQLGRQEWLFGSQRMVGVREGTNVRRRYDGAILTRDMESYKAQAFWGRPVQPETGIFDDSGIFGDSAASSDALWGLYLTMARPFAQWEVYYLGSRFREAFYADGSGRETRHSTGMRFQREANGFDLNWEVIYQFGSVGEKDIRAATLATISGYTFHETLWTPRIAISANIAEGDRHNGDYEINTFRAPFPRGNYFSQAAVLGPSNFHNIHGFVTINPAPGLVITGDLNFYRRLEATDGIYAPPGFLLFQPNPSSDDGISRSWDLDIEQTIKSWTIQLILTRLEPQSFFTGTNTKPTGFLEFTIKYVF